MRPPRQGVLYWDSSAVLSLLFQDAHSRRAAAAVRKSAVHLLSTLAWAEVHAVIARARRERALADVLIDAAREALDRGPWRRANISPEWGMVREMASRWALRGADLWHLCAAKTLKADLPELELLTFDARLRAAARAERLARGARDN
ncbi:MAG: PIN domain-containing protein [Armatimonadota bacterium]|nr:PIN domain-containing protein [Armatimonadota bacterium]MDR7422028.1 PIN domain-containing protein [Armatimonadota bacterium]MDR7454168.1 PIN domain-containing protein [Armatimonadota bacterium]MDR7455729.1 PIN domain-containing protein [Armatimonadota bacterium]MDR7496974.1 PIN domain-containing protein [Armatimonadota bacterium]